MSIKTLRCLRKEVELADPETFTLAISDGSGAASKPCEILQDLLIKPLTFKGAQVLQIKLKRYY